MSLAGHFFCSFCDDIVFTKFTGERVVKCPVCHRRKAEWLPDALRRVVFYDGEEFSVLARAEKRATIAAWFAAMRMEAA